MSDFIFGSGYSFSIQFKKAIFIVAKDKPHKGVGLS